jgi:SAM-dependent methyltransferase
MSVAAHLNINLDEYDARIRSFIPQYEVMIATAAEMLRLLAVEAPLIVDLGIGTGALARACLAVRPDARLHGVDEDAGMLDVARQRLGNLAPATFAHGSFLDEALPSCDAIVASFALHHVRTADRKRALYAACRQALRLDGLLISADCFTATDPSLMATHREAWRAHLEETYSRREAEDFLAAWAHEDVYFPLADELAMLSTARFMPDVVWRSGSFAVVSARAS